MVGEGLRSRRTRRGDGRLCLIGVGKMLEACEAAADLLAADGVHAEVWDPRAVRPLCEEMLTAAVRCKLVVTVEDGLREGGAGAGIRDALDHVRHRDDAQHSEQTLEQETQKSSSNAGSKQASAENGVEPAVATESAASAEPADPTTYRQLHPPRVKVLGVPVDYLPHGRPDDILASLGLDATGIAEAARSALADLSTH